jgi:caa(3)-type oxidase subunit IV
MSSNQDLPGHILPKSTVVASYVALVFLTLVMVGLSRVDVSHFDIDWIDLHAVKACLIMGTALVSGIIVSMFLMGLRYESKLLNLTVFLSNFVFLLIFVLFTWVDTSFRGEVDPTFTQKINFVSPVKVETEGEHATTVQPGSQVTAPAGTNAPAAAPADTAKAVPPSSH